MVNYSQFLAEGLSAAVCVGGGRAEGRAVAERGASSADFQVFQKPFPVGRTTSCSAAELLCSEASRHSLELRLFPYQDGETMNAVVEERDFSKAHPLQIPEERRHAACFAPV